jgi:hypothetical protein
MIMKRKILFSLVAAASLVLGGCNILNQPDADSLNEDYETLISMGCRTNPYSEDCMADDARPKFCKDMETFKESGQSVSSNEFVFGRWSMEFRCEDGYALDAQGNKVE